MADESPQTLVAVAFDDVLKAREFLTAATRLAVNGKLSLRDAVFVVKEPDGRVLVQETTDPTAKGTALGGALWAGLFGLLLGGPVGWLAGAAVGAGAGAITARVVDLGIPDEWVEWFKAADDPGRTILALLVTDVDRPALVDELSRFAGARLVYANLDQFTIDRIAEALGTPAPVFAESGTPSVPEAAEPHSVSSDPPGDG